MILQLLAGVDIKYTKTTIYHSSSLPTTTIIGGHANSLVRGVMNFLQKGGREKFSRGAGGKRVSAEENFNTITYFCARRKFHHLFEDCHSHGFKSILACETRLNPQEH